jgi:hypothetical protein
VRCRDIGGTYDHDVELLLSCIGKAVDSHRDAIFSPCRDLLRVIEDLRS